MKSDDMQSQKKSPTSMTVSREGSRVGACDTKTSNKTKRKSSTTLMCELTRLKSQQKYLECNQVKLIVDNFFDTDGSSNTNTTGRPTQTNNSSVINLINEIEKLKTQFDSELAAFRQKSRTAVKDMCLQIKHIREDIQQPDRLQLYPIGALREHIIGINAQIERLNSKNAAELQLLQKECENLEIDTTILIK